MLVRWISQHKRHNVVGVCLGGNWVCSYKDTVSLDLCWLCCAHMLSGDWPLAWKKSRQAIVDRFSADEEFACRIWKKVCFSNHVAVLLQPTYHQHQNSKKWNEENTLYEFLTYIPLDFSNIDGSSKIRLLFKSYSIAMAAAMSSTSGFKKMTLWKCVIQMFHRYPTSFITTLTTHRK